MPGPSGIDFYINRTHIARIKEDTAASGAAGLLAISSGMVLFDNFTVYKPAGSHGADPKAKQEQPAAPTPAAILAPDTQSSRLDSYINMIEPGMPKQRVIELLGPPAYLRGSRFFYDLAESGANDGGDTLVVQFDKDDRLVNHKTMKK